MGKNSSYIKKRIQTEEEESDWTQGIMDDEENEIYNATGRNKRAIKKHRKRKRVENIEIELQSPTFPPMENDYIEGINEFASKPC